MEVYLDNTYNMIMMMMMITMMFMMMIMMIIYMEFVFHALLHIVD